MLEIVLWVVSAVNHPTGAAGRCSKLLLSSILMKTIHKTRQVYTSKRPSNLTKWVSNLLLSFNLWKQVSIGQIINNICKANVA